RSQGSRLLPVLIESDAAHPLLTSVQHADLAGDPSTARSAIGRALSQVDAEGGLGWPDDRSPFPGLRAFDADMHRAFFGREDDVEAIAALLRSPSVAAHRELLVVVGPSGCGKSSLVRAGVIPVLATEPDWWMLPPFLLGTDPVVALAGELAAAARRL